MADGSIVFETALDNKTLEKELNRLNKKIRSLEEQIYSKTQQKIPLVAQSRELAAVLDEAKYKLAEMQNAARGTYGSDQIKEQAERVRLLQAEWNKVQGRVESLDDGIQKANIELDRAKELAGGIHQELAAAGYDSKKMSKSMDKANKSAKKFSNRMKSIVAGALFFNLISSGLRQFTDWMGNVIKTNDKAVAAIAKLKGALLTLAQPLVEVIIPAFIAFVQVLTQVVAAAASLISKLFGTTAEQSAKSAKALNEETKALNGTGSAAEDAAGSLAGFDEINTIQTEDKTSSGTDTSGIEADFDFLGSVNERLMDIAKAALAVAAGLGLWKLGSSLSGALGTIFTKLGGIAFAVGGLILLWNGLKDAWENGIDWGNFAEMLGGVAFLAGGLALAFGSIGAGIGLIVGGLAMLVTGFKDAFDNGWNLQNMLTAIAGILATGLGISLLAGSWIPLFIAAIAALLLQMTIVTGHGEELLSGIQTMLEGFKDFFTGIFTGDIDKAVGGLEKIFDGLKTAVFAVVDGIKDTFLGFFDWLDEKTGGKFHGIIEFMKGLFSGLFDFAKETLGNVIDTVKEILKGIVQFLTGVFTGDWDKAWDGVKNIFKGVWNGIIGVLESAVNLIIRGVNWLISQLNKISFSVPSWVPGVGGKSIGINIPSINYATIPRLAQGAVIPPNREFMAVLGDQTSGNNLEAPESLIRKIVREEAGGMNTEVLEAILSVLKQGQVIKVNETVFGRTAAKAINTATLAAGHSILKP